jgi:hypothetical protein
VCVSLFMIVLVCLICVCKFAMRMSLIDALVCELERHEK